MSLYHFTFALDTVSASIIKRLYLLTRTNEPVEELAPYLGDEKLSGTLVLH